MIKYSINNVLKLLIGLISMGYIVSCAPDAPMGAEQQKSSGPIIPEQPLDFVRVIVAGDDISLNVSGFDRRLKYFFDTYKNRDASHVIVHPAVHSQLGIDEAHGIIHEREEAYINDTIVDIANKHGPKRMVLFLATHGAAAGGSLCYKSQQACSYTGQSLHAMVKALDEANQRKNPQHQLKQLLIVPLSCYNKALAEILFSELNKGEFKSFAITMTHMLHHGPEKSLAGISASEALFRGGFYISEFAANQFNTWVSSSNRVDRLLTLTKLDEYMVLANEVMVNNVEDIGHQQQARLSWFARNQQDADIKLDDFQLSMKHITFTRTITDAPPGYVPVGGVYRTSPRGIAHALVTPAKLRGRISWLHSSVDNITYDRKALNFQTERDWPEENQFTIHFSY